MNVAITGLSLIMVASTIAPAAMSAERNSEGTATPFSPQTSQPNVVPSKAVSPIATSNPFDIAFLAYRGYFRSQGVPSYETLTQAIRSGRVKASDVVKAAVATRQVPDSALSDRRFIDTVEKNLRALEFRR